MVFALPRDRWIRTGAAMLIPLSVFVTFVILSQDPTPGIMGAGFFLVSVGGAILLGMPDDLRDKVNPRLAWLLIGVGALYIVLGDATE